MPAVEINRVSFLVLRELRRPIMVLLLVYAFSIIVITYTPGPVIDGKTHHMSIFHAIYFVTYTVTTTGFGEIPGEFSDAQRLVAMVILYVGVIAWLYSIGAIIHLMQNEHFQNALKEHIFINEVNRLSSGFVIICGFGDTGSLLARGLSDNYISGVVIEANPDRIKALALRDYRVAMPGLCADASIPKHLLEAGIRSPNCDAIVTVTNDEEVNLRIAVLARLLNPDLHIIARSKVEVYEEMLASLTDHVAVIDPFKTFADGLMMSIYNPVMYALDQWLVGARGASLKKAVCPPRGAWVICGYGHMGHEIHRVFDEHDIPTVIIDSEINDVDAIPNLINGRPTERTLRRAGVDKAAGIVSATADDGHNLAILVNARTINNSLFSVVRQNLHQNEVAFSAADADIIMQPSLVTARRILFRLIAPMLNELQEYLHERNQEDSEYINRLIEHLSSVVGYKTPHMVTITLTRQDAPALIHYLNVKQVQVTLDDLLRDPRMRDEHLTTLPLVIHSGQESIILPDLSYQVKENDKILLCGRSAAHRLLNASLNNPYTLYYLITGQDQTRSWFLKAVPRLINQIKQTLSGTSRSIQNG
ncbi:MAG: NAD-binding protein [Gammaproteobacteria bacterium]|nr:NAD-binding protein [Gammaproteobacteria bacterium]